MRREDENKPCCSKSLPKEPPEPSVDNRVPIPRFSPLSFENKFTRTSVISYSPTNRNYQSLPGSSSNGKGFLGSPLIKTDYRAEEDKINDWLNTNNSNPSTPTHLKRKRGDPDEIHSWEFLYEPNLNFKTPTSGNINNVRARKTIPTCTVTTNFLEIRRKEKEEAERKKAELEQAKDDIEKKSEPEETQNNEKAHSGETQNIVEKKHSEEVKNNNLKDEEIKVSDCQTFDPKLLKWRPYLDISVASNISGGQGSATFSSEEVASGVEYYESVSSGEENENKWTPNTSRTDSMENTELPALEIIPKPPAAISRFIEDFPKTKEQEEMDLLAAITKSISEK